jgi:hypothetical protein
VIESVMKKSFRLSCSGFNGVALILAATVCKL